MNPCSSIATNVNISSDYDFNRFILAEANARQTRITVVPVYVVWFASFLCLSVNARATAVAIMVTPDRIVMAADGAGEIVHPGSVYTFEPVCKIMNYGDIFYTAAGYYEVPDTGFSVWNSARNAIQRSKAIGDIYPLIEGSLSRSLPAVIANAKLEDPASYTLWTSGIAVISIAFARFEDKVPRVITVEFHVDNRGRLLKANTRTLGGTGKPLEEHFMGANEEMVAAVDSRRLSAWGSRFFADPVEFTHGLIQDEIDAAQKAGSKIVGPPVAVLSITNAGARFQPGLKGACK